MMREPDALDFTILHICQAIARWLRLDVVTLWMIEHLIIAEEN
jgi:hypothetical protein